MVLAELGDRVSTRAVGGKVQRLHKHWYARKPFVPGRRGRESKTEDAVFVPSCVLNRGQGKW